MEAGVPLPMTAKLPSGQWFIYGGIYDELSGRSGGVLLRVTVPQRRCDWLGSSLFAQE
jgi:hypothetical protein